MAKYDNPTFEQLERLQQELDKTKGRLAELEARELLVGKAIDYSSVCTVVGWGSFTNKIIWYATVGNLVIFHASIDGTSNSTSLTLSLPFIPAGQGCNFIVRVRDNTGAFVGGLARSTAGGILDVFPTIGGGTWTASGTKEVRATILYTKAP